MKNLMIAVFFLIGFSSCEKEECQTCTKTIGGFAGNFTDEVREVCDTNEARELEESSSGTTTWECE
jgi:hypothetical protein